MGCVQSRDPGTPAPIPKGKTGGSGVLGGSSDAGDLSPQQAAAQAAQIRRQASAGDAESRDKRELIGRIDAVYSQRGQSRPLHVGSMGVPELRVHLEKLKSGTA